MKLLNYITSLLLITSFSCNKNDVQQNLVPPLETNTLRASDINDATSAGLYYDKATGNSTLILQPGKEGNDLWFKYWKGHPSYANTNESDVQLIKSLAWKVKNTLLITRSVVKFDSLSKIPTTAQIMSAKLYLYGPSPSSPDVNTHFPMGNSSYPGSTHQENSTYIQRITSPWSQNTISWNNQPSTTTLNESILTASTQQWNYNTSADVTGLVKPMVSNKNYGFMLKLRNENIFRSLGFLSSETSESGKRPKLVVVFK